MQLLEVLILKVSLSQSSFPKSPQKMILEDLETFQSNMEFGLGEGPTVGEGNNQN